MQSMQITKLAADLARQEDAGDYLAVIAGVRRTDRRRPGRDDRPVGQGWIGRRWRDLFLQEAVKDKDAVEFASKPALLAAVPLPSMLKKDNPRRAIAERFLRTAPTASGRRNYLRHSMTRSRTPR